MRMASVRADVEPADQSLQGRVSRRPWPVFLVCKNGWAVNTDFTGSTKELRTPVSREGSMIWPWEFGESDLCLPWRRLLRF